jgi:hypothetical protein
MVNQGMVVHVCHHISGNSLDVLFFMFPIVNFPFICSNIPAAPAYEVYISTLIQYSGACGSYQDFLDRGLLLTEKLLNQE